MARARGDSVRTAMRVAGCEWLSVVYYKNKYTSVF